MEVEEEGVFTVDEEANDDFRNSIISRFRNDQNLCAVIGAMSQELRDHNLPSSPVAYFGATCSSLDCIASEPNPPNHLIHALLTILSLLLARVPFPVLKKKSELLSEPLARVLGSQSSVSDIALVYALKCLSHLLINGDGDSDNLVNVLLGFLTDSRPKVRRQSHLCLRDVLLNSQNSSLLASVSEGVTKQLNARIAGGANANAGEGTKGAQQVLYLLDALKECLPFLSLTFKTKILNCFKTLLELGQPLVTRRIRDGLNFLCLQPTSEIPPEALLELLRSLACSISSNKMSGDEMTFTARLLDAGMNKVYSLNRQKCVDNLPFVFNSLKDILASEHEEATYAATNALKSMINSCIDESLIKQGVDQIALDELRISERTIEKICATIESLLHYHYTAVWDRVFQVVSAMFHKLGNYSPCFTRGILKNLKDMQKLPGEDFPFRKQLHICLGSALVAMGPETFLSLIPLNLEAEDLSDANIWLFPILKQYIVGARLSYFTEEILPMIERIREKAQKLEKQGLIVSSRNADALAYSLWSLLPSFCNNPMDTAKSFLDLQKHLCNKLKEEPDIRGIICTSLQLLIQQNNNIVDSNDKDCIGHDISNEQVLVHYSQQVATQKSPAKNLLKDLSEVFLKSTKDDGGCLQRTIGYIASISDKADVHNLFKEKMQKLVECTRKANEVDYSKNSMQIDDTSNNVSPSIFRGQFLDFAVSLLPSLDDEDIALLFQEIKPALQDVEGVKQKKAYKVLSIILRSSDSFVSLKFEELLGFMVEILPSCHFSSERYRLDCLYYLIVHVSKSKDNLGHWPENAVSLLTEIILALKEANKKTRNTAYDILVEIAHAYGDEERGGNREYLYQFFIMVAVHLAGITPHMISAAAKGLACLAYEFSDLVLTAFNLLPSTFLLLQRKNRKIIKANLGLLKVLVVKSQVEGLQMHLRSMVEGLLRCKDSTKNHFKAKVKLLLGMLVTKCGLAAVKAVMPEEHMKLLSNIHKIKGRKERNRGAKSEETRSHLSKATTSRQSTWNHTNCFSDFDGDSDSSDAEYLNARTISRGDKTCSHLQSEASSFEVKKNLLEHLCDQLCDEPLDLLDRGSAFRSAERLKRKSSRLDDDEVEVDSEGRLIVRQEGGEWKKANFDIRSEPDSHLCGTKAQKRRKTSYSDSGWAYTGREYGSKKAAGGDAKRKGKLEPYAYWPLDRKMMSRRQHHRAAARKGMASVVKTTKKASLKGSVLSLKSVKL